MNKLYKTSLLLASLLALQFSLLAQARLMIDKQYLVPVKSVLPKDGPTPLKHTVTSSVPPVAASIFSQEIILGNTVYDLQTNASMQSRLVIRPDGQRAAAWIMSLERTDTYTDRGTGYNFFQDGNWQDIPEARLESQRVGWPSLTYLDDGRIQVVTHNADSELLTLTMNLDGSDKIESKVPSNVPQGLFWPRSASSGQTLHVIGLTTPSGNFGGAPFNGMEGHLLYARSPDAGLTWDVVDFSLPGLDTSLYSFISADTYTISAQDDIVAITIFASWGDLTLFKSIDGGDSWSKSTVFDFPLDGYTVDDGYSQDDLPVDASAPNPLAILTCDGSGATTIDDNGVVHIAFSDLYVMDTVLTDSLFSLFPSTSGVRYWNDRDQAVQFVGDLVDLNDNDTLDIEDFRNPFPRYVNHTLTSMPTISVNNQGGVIIVYSAISELFFNELDEEHYRHLIAVRSLDDGQNWGPPYDLINPTLLDPDVYEFVEAVYPFAHNRFGDTLHLIYQQDFFPGHTLDDDTNDPQADNFIVHLGVPVDLIPDINTVSTVEYLSSQFTVFPTLAEEKINIEPKSLESFYSVTLLDVNGRMILRQRMQLGNQVLNVNALQTGFYFLHIASQQESTIYKIMKL